MERLQEREGEVAVLEAAVEGAEVAGSLVLVEGPPGIGKTRLVEAAREQAQGRDMLVLDARASELESGVPFGIVRQLFEPIVRGSGPGLLEGAAASPDGASRPAGRRPDDQAAARAPDRRLPRPRHRPPVVHDHCGAMSSATHLLGKPRLECAGGFPVIVIGGATAPQRVAEVAP